MDRIEIKFSRTKLILLALLALIFVVGGVFILFIAKDLRGKIVGWTAIIFFGFGLIIFLKQILNTAPRLILDDEGIEDKSLGIGKISWEDIEAAYPNNMFSNKFVSLQINNVEKYLARNPKRRKNLEKKLVSSNHNLGFEALNLNLVGLSISQKDLMTLITAHLFISAKKNGQLLVKSDR